MAIKEWIKQFFGNPSTQTKSVDDVSQTNLKDTLNGLTINVNNRNDLDFMKSNAQFSNSNLGTIININLAGNEKDVKGLLPQIRSRINAIKKLINESSLVVALDECRKLLEEQAINGPFDKEINSEIYILLIVISINSHDDNNAEKYIRTFIEAGLNKSTKFYSSAFTYYFNAKLYETAQEILNEAMLNFPNAFVFKAFCVINNAAWINSPYKTKYTDQYLNDEWSCSHLSESNTEEETQTYHETLQLYYLIYCEFDKSMELFEISNCKKTLMMKLYYIRAKFCKATNMQHINDYFEHNTIDYPTILEIYDKITNLESECIHQEKDTLYRYLYDVYCSCLILLGKASIILDKNLTCYVEDDESKRALMTNVLLQGNKEAAELASPLVKDVEFLKSESAYEKIINLLWPQIKSWDIVDTYFIINLLLSCLNSNKDQSFCEVTNWLKQNGKMTDECYLAEAVYLHKHEARTRALDIIDNLYNRSCEPRFIINLLSILQQCKEYVLAYKYTEDVCTNKNYVVNISADSFFEFYHLALTKTNAWEDYAVLISRLESSNISDIPKAKILLAYAEKSRNQIARAQQADFLYECTNDSQYLFISASAKIAMFDIDGLASCIDHLKRIFGENNDDLNIIIAEYYILIGDNEKARSIAQIAIKNVQDKPTSPVHQFFVALSIRIGDRESLGYIYQFANMYPSPRHRTWFKEIHAINEGSDGKHTLSEEVIGIFKEMSKKYLHLINLYNSSPVGMSFIIDIYSWGYNTMYMLLKRLHVFNGSAELLVLEQKHVLHNITVDSLSLYFLAKMNLLNILLNCQTIFVPYATISALVNNIFIEEDSAIREIFKFIKQSPNIEYSFPDIKTKSDIFKELGLQLFDAGNFESLVDSCIVASKTNSVYLYGDAVCHYLNIMLSGKSTSIIAFIKSAHSKGWIDDLTFGKALLDMARLNISFVNINFMDLYFAYKMDDTTSLSLFRKLIEIKIGGDVKTYMSVYYQFLNKVISQVSIETYVSLIKIFIEAIDKRYGRTFYHIDFYKGMQKIPYIVIQKLCTQGISLVLSTLIDKYSYDEIFNFLKSSCKKIPESKYKELIEQASDAKYSIDAHQNQQSP